MNDPAHFHFSCNPMGEYLLITLVGFGNAWFDLEGLFPWKALSLRENISADGLSQPLYVSSG